MMLNEHMWLKWKYAHSAGSNNSLESIMVSKYHTQALDEFNRKQAPWKKVLRFDQLNLDQAMWVTQRAAELASGQTSFGGATTQKPISRSGG
jgi:hypothetical protein